MSFPVQGLSKPRRLELEYAFRQFDTRRKGGLTFLELKRLLKSIGVSLNRSELNFLQMEEDIRGMFILEDLFALCEAFYTDEMIKERLMRSLEAHFPGKNSANREQLKSLLCKLGRSLKVGPSEIDAFLNLYGGDNSKTEISFNNFVQMVLSE